MGARPGPRPKTFGDPDFKGHGKIKCGICDKPLSKHEGLGPCPELRLAPGERMTLTRKIRQEKPKAESHEDARDEQETESKASDARTQANAGRKG